MNIFHYTMKHTAAAVSLLLIAAPAAYAQSTYSVQVDGAPLDLKDVKRGDAVGLATGLERGTICCSIHALLQEHKLFFSQILTSSNPDSGYSALPFKSRGIMSPRTSKGTNAEALSASDINSRVCFDHGRSNYRLMIGAAAGSSEADDTSYSARVQCTDNTLYGGFNLNGSELNFLEVQYLGREDAFTDPSENPEGNDIDIEIDLEAEYGSGRSGFQNESVYFYFSGPTTSRRDIPVHDLFIPGSWGTIRLTHDGAPGSIKASVKRYKINPANPADFTLVGIEPLETR